MGVRQASIFKPTVWIEQNCCRRQSHLACRYRDGFRRPHRAVAAILTATPAHCSAICDGTFLRTDAHFHATPRRVHGRFARFDAVHLLPRQRLPFNTPTNRTAAFSHRFSEKVVGYPRGTCPALAVPRRCVFPLCAESHTGTVAARVSFLCLLRVRMAVRLLKFPYTRRVRGARKPVNAALVALYPSFPSDAGCIVVSGVDALGGTCFSGHRFFAPEAKIGTFSCDKFSEGVS